MPRGARPLFGERGGQGEGRRGDGCCVPRGESARKGATVRGRLSPDARSLISGTSRIPAHGVHMGASGENRPHQRSQESCARLSSLFPQRTAPARWCAERGPRRTTKFLYGILAAQVLLERDREGLQVAHRRVIRLGARVDARERDARDRAALFEDTAPQLAPLPEAVVALVGAEAEQHADNALRESDQRHALG
eukprot:3667749-Prymnesium_polylepis.1